MLFDSVSLPLQLDGCWGCKPAVPSGQHLVVLRNSLCHATGIYSVLEDGLAALEDDVRATCDLFRSAAKRTGSDFAADLGDVSPCS